MSDMTTVALTRPAFPAIVVLYSVARDAGCAEIIHSVFPHVVIIDTPEPVADFERAR